MELDLASWVVFYPGGMTGWVEFIGDVEREGAPEGIVLVNRVLVVWADGTRTWEDAHDLIVVA